MTITNHPLHRSGRALLAVRVATLVLSFFLYLCMLPIVSRTSVKAQGGIRPEFAVIPPGSAYRQTNFISDIPGFAPILDPLLVNPWGISKTASSPFWIANNGTSTTQLVKGDASGNPVVLNASPQTVTIPGGLPTGTVANTTSDFVLPGACAAPPCTARFIFDSITGNIVGWSPNAPAAGSTTGVIAASHPGRVYTGLAIGSNGGGNRLYAADFGNGNIDVYDGTFTLTTVTGGFVDPTIPNTMGNVYHPFNIQNIGGSLYVTYAKVDPMTGESEAGVGNGFVRRFNTDGVRDLTFGINNGPLNAPWGITIAPATFGLFGSALLVGNFGEGNPSIQAFDPTTGTLLGTLQNEAGDGIVIDELWALTFGNGGNGGDPNALYFSAGTAEEEHGLFGSLRPTTASATSLIQFATDDFAISEGSGHIDITVTRAGDASGTAIINFNTYDASQPGHASQKSDYEISLRQLTFGPGETSKTVRILIVNDNFVEGDEVVNLVLSNPNGTGVGLGSPNAAQLTITENDTVAPTTNPIDDANFFVRQHYLDFLNREPDTSGFNFWVSQITSCGSNPACIDTKRVNVSAAFFLSIEFQQTGMLVYLTHKASFGSSALGGSPVPVLYGDFMHDAQALQRDFVVGQPGADTQLESNKQAFFLDVVSRPQFRDKYSVGLTPAQFVDALFLNAGVTPTATQRQAAIDEFGGALNTTDSGARARALRRVAENAAFSAAEFNRAFVAMEYFGYLRRDPDTAGYNFWLNKLNAAGGNFINSDMVKSFIVSSEYRQRFGPN